jgi:enoyl-CoA hydratase/carnithine racemase
MTDTPTVEFQTDGAIATITLNRPEQRNAVNGQLARELHAAMCKFEADASLSVAILTGRGTVFCSGMDLAAFLSGEADTILNGPGRFAGFVGMERSKPVIAAVQGTAVAGGFEIVLACDMVVMAESARLGLPEAKRGLIAGGGGAFRLAQRLPPTIVNELLLTGDPIDANRALHLGLVNRVSPDDAVMDTARELAAKVAASAPLSLRYSLEVARMAADGDSEALWAFNNQCLNILRESEDVAEGARAFLEKRAPEWRGK